MAASACILAAGCQTKQRQVAYYDWDFKQISEKASKKTDAFATCEDASRKRYRFVSDYNDQVFQYANGVAACMRLEGWGLTKNPVTFKDQAD
jgi:hypothetical protein